MRLRLGQDLATGLLFISIGFLALWISADYPMGIPQRPGTGVLPRILCWCLVVTGGLLLIKSIAAGDAPISSWAWRPMLAVTVGTIAFALHVDSLGLIVAIASSLTLCALGTPETRWPEYLIFLTIMIVIGVATFVWLLGMPIPVWPVKLPGYLEVIVPAMRGN